MHVNKLGACDHVQDVVTVGGSRVYLDHLGRVLAAKRAVMFNGIPEPVPERVCVRPSFLARWMPRLDLLWS
jgi:hypothetical protein